ncbi:hypothetical protein [Salinibacter ruber]|uniref:Uncharacterized protein n=1 Tax=Salinibacter ruber TaxID=146919 RepID=A0A9X2Q156_9BACT|nr:hypothetical protein [Salinibacter ruber]MCS3634645.1 hypothetical protein [Salinibacter ruber]MCS3679092.1 hypothetical protein [Salinibacter ruber]MCS3682234.1 hypothetical protein [Salinibacter ruber]MCS3714135.1 hypothetical protein [Salinibacter ruber]MCS3938585.1 hypothetical protein [Salinibacter ruber]
MIRWIARAAWLVPVLMVVLSLHQGKVAYDLHSTKTEGTTATAEVQTVHASNRTQVTYDYVSLRVPMPDGSTLTRERLSLPHGIVPALKGRETLQVRVMSGGSRSIVVTEAINSTPVVDTQIRIAGINGLMSFGAALLFGIVIWFWNRSLRRDGDPAERGLTEADPNHPARQVVR